MSWTIVCDLPLHEYTATTAIDESKYGNHANLLGSPSPHYTYVSFAGAQQQMVIPVRDDSLQRFTGLKLEALVNPNTRDHRLNIIEGLMSFAFVIQPSGMLLATIYDGQNWIGVDSGNTLVPLNTWSSVGFEYDGLSIGKIYLNGQIAGHNIDMPMGMHQPQQHITIGHWPGGDGRYTFSGDIGHTRISRRDYEDFWRDAFTSMLCRKCMSLEQAAAIQELHILMNSLDRSTLNSIRACAEERSRLLMNLFRPLRANSLREIARERELTSQLLAIWCCGSDYNEGKRLLREFLLQHAGREYSEERRQFRSRLKDYLALSTHCQRSGNPFDAMNALLKKAVPGLYTLHEEIEKIFVSI